MFKPAGVINNSLHHHLKVVASNNSPPHLNSHGAIFVAGSLHGPCPAAPIAATRNQYFVPLVRPLSVALLFVDTPPIVQLVPVIGSGLFWIM